MGLMAISAAPLSAWTRPSSSTSSKNIPVSSSGEPLFRECDEGTGVGYIGALPARSWSFPTVRRRLLRGAMKHYLTQIAGSAWQEISRDLLARRARDAATGVKPLILSSLCGHWQPAAQLFSRMIATSRAYAVSVLPIVFLR